jgi:hypothetical protein
VCWGRHGWQSDVQSEGDMATVEIRGTTTADGPRRRRCKRAALRATVLHTTAAAAGENGSTGSPQRAVWCGRPWWLGIHDVFYSEAEEGSKRGRRSVLCPVSCVAPLPATLRSSLHLRVEALFIRCAAQKTRATKLGVFPTTPASSTRGH